MAAHLPHDALALILDELAHPAHSYESYLAQQETLKSVCLASRRLYRLAQPSLWRQIIVGTPEQLERVRSSPQLGALGRYTRSYTVLGSGHLEEAVAVLSLLPEVVDLRVQSRPLFPFRLASLEQRPSLRRLDIAMASLPVGSCATLPAVEELCIRQAWSSVDHFREQLQPARLPRLRELFFVNNREMAPVAAALQLVNVLPPDLLPQLDLVQTDAVSIDPSSDLAQGFDPPVLVFNPPAVGPPRALPRHSISQPARFKDAPTALSTLANLDASIRLIPPRPSHDPPYLLLLPQSLRTLAAAESTIAPQLEALEALCAERRVTVEWSEELPEGELVSPEFRRYARRLRAARARERQGGPSGVARNRFAMSARLINDVLIMILDELAPPQHAPDKYRARQETLRNVCLASRRLRRLAQPMLWRQVILRSREQLDSLFAAAPGALGRYTKLLIVLGTAQLGLDEAVAQASTLSEVVEIRVTSLVSFEPFAPFDFTLLAHFTKLRRLHVENVKPHDGRSATWPALEELCLRECRASPAWIQQQLRAAQLPSLRELYVVRMSSVPRKMHVWLDMMVAPDFFRRLDVLQADALSSTIATALAQDPLAPVLVRHTERDRGLPLPRHTICDARLFHYKHAVLDSLSALSSRLQLPPPAPSSSTTMPRLLILPPNLRRLADARPLVMQHMRMFETLCVEKGVRIVWDDELPVGELLSPAFRRYARELREARALER
ncbi:hypothetical protein JCM8208_002038 [Rhodotorula glutinis]